MADISTDLAAWSGTAGSNSPSGSTSIGTGLDDNLRAIQAAIVLAFSAKGSDLASATTVDLSATNGLFHDVTGTTTITGLGTVRAGVWKILKFEGALTFTHNATSLIIPGGANITTANGDMCMVTSEGSGNWRVNWFTKADGTALVGALPVVDTTAIVKGSSDATKLMRFEVDGLTTGTTRVLTVPDFNFTLGAVVQRVYAEYTTAGSTATTIPVDDTIPQISEGVEIITAAITPKSTNNKIRVTVSVPCSGNTAINAVAAVFRDAVTDGLWAWTAYVGGAGETQWVGGSFEETAPSTSSITYRLRIGPGANTMYLNGTSSRLFGGVSRCVLILEEVS